jgi:RNA polymerase sigma-70 factor (ECF subfamily)
VHDDDLVHDLVQARAAAAPAAIVQTLSVNADQFAVQADRYRRELLAHCYKMVGSIHEAEDLVQETYARAWRGWDAFEGRSSVRTWLYRIATNLCLSSLGASAARPLPAGLADLDVELVRTPFPTRPAEHDPAAAAEARDDLRLALIASLQLLPARQRAVFILREALSFPAADIADLLDMSVAAVKSALQRARGRLAETAARSEPLGPDDLTARRALEGYMLAFEAADTTLLANLLKAEAVLAVHPGGPVLQGKRACVAYLADQVLTAPGAYRMTRTEANGQPAALAWLADAAGVFRPLGVAVLTVDGAGITRIDAFIDAILVAVFDGERAPAD